MFFKPNLYVKVQIALVLVIFNFNVLYAGGVDDEEVSKKFTIDSFLTSVIPGALEANIIIYNQSLEPLSFVIIPEKVDQSCLEKIYELGYKKHYSNIDTLPTSGFIPPNGWMHRAFVLSKPEYERPCPVVFRVLLDDEVTVEFNKNEKLEFVPDPYEGNKIEIEVSSYSEFVSPETDKFIFIRTKVKNNSNFSGHFLITERKITCPDAVKVDWNLQTLIPRGVDYGPIFIQTGGTGVFIQDLKLVSGLDFIGCSVRLKFSIIDPVESVVTGEQVFIQIKEVNVALDPID